MDALRLRTWIAAVAAAAIVCCLFVAGCRQRPAPPPTAVPSIARLAGVTVVLDPGHGGQDTGAIRAGVYEYAVNYRMAAILANLLRSQGANIVFTVISSTLAAPAAGRVEPPLVRPRDARLAWNGLPVRLRADESPDDLYRRSAMIRNVQTGRAASGPIVFVALHCDELGGAPGRGARVYYDRRSGRPCRLAMILKRRLTAAGLTNSAGGRVIPRHYGVLNPTYNVCPESVLVEMATLSDSRDRRAVRDPAWRRRMAGILADSIAECCGRLSPST